MELRKEKNNTNQLTREPSQKTDESLGLLQKSLQRKGLE